MQAYYPELVAPVRWIGRREFDFARHIVVMGIVNRTPNSGLDPNRSMEVGEAVARAEQALREGAEWIDVGGRAFRSDQPPLSAAEEIDRVVPVIRGIRELGDVVISVDTHLPEVAEASHKAGADLINDTHGLRSPGMAELIAETGMSVVITHSLGGPGEKVERPAYGDVVSEVAAFLRQRADYAVGSGIDPEKIIIDPGHDLNKNTQHSNALTRRLREITAIGYPTLVACSNKHFIRESLGAQRGADELRIGTIAANTMCVYQGARIVRVHDVAGNVAAMSTAERVLGLTER
ncbi:dihydropteroate synthase [Nonomuraea sp. SYSU D8015]|uniref:dihydropteroate synthase n=1 Tax=Nonomuraea sp. SYSU D8015 TaxID=2593644 RepID=UPI001660DC0D|nr:dihydropteroate synthase [Nonomuraea sp. SYSU D8015]